MTGDMRNPETTRLRLVGWASVATLLALSIGGIGQALRGGAEIADSILTVAVSLGTAFFLWRDLVVPFVAWDEQALTIQNPFAKHVLRWDAVTDVRVIWTLKDRRGLIVVAGGAEIAVWAVKPGLNFWDRGARARELAKDLEGRLHSTKESD